MWKRNPKAPASSAPGLDRRAFLGGSAALLFTPWLARAQAPALPQGTRDALAESPYVYVSPLRSDGAESTCHGEVWYGWHQQAVFLVTSATSWKSRALARGLDRARIWVGDHGRWKRPILGAQDAFRKAPSFDARVSASKDDDAFGALMKSHARKYGASFTEVWKPRMEAGYADGSRLLLRYEPLLRT